MEGNLNRIKVVLAENEKTNRWLSKELDRSEVTVSRWCRNVQQPDLETLYRIAEVLDISIYSILVDNKKKGIESDES